ncbi:conserved hypothetical protein [Neospora caninum Liverpool]|uniref:Ribosome biogenesis protein NOP53 n=1 Tax=Neospora caninum (strain Liverpool) TaxID=572307 RepID=F0VG17_NEOCL|nr:conserved hypothetical protein [Neospora caninum Liverpool]CBZ52661.1 conserved hypothetical protein [Neospora caninum Liverpool]CEL66638.1 TPA: hypothetical protein BN1204_024490 [Neospora caninum Liverpool]|eukprot:XP_003882693.1 conserved hypothetical protein [Neospora caninum Liverpool]
MPPPSKKQKWRRTDLSSTEQHVEDLTLHERVERLDAAGELFTLDTEGTSAAANLTQRALRLVKSRTISQADWRNKPRDSSCLASRKAPLLQVVSKHHKKQLLKVLKQKDAENAQPANGTAPPPASGETAKKPQKARSASHLAVDVWGTSISASEKPSRKKRTPSWPVSSSPSSALSVNASEALAAAAQKSETAEQRSDGKASKKRRREETEAPSPDAASPSRSDERQKAEKPRSSTTPSSSETRASSRGKTTRSRLTARALRSFDSLRSLVPALQTPEHGESYNPSPEAHAHALLTAAVCTLEEREQWQQTGAHSRSQHLLPRQQEALEALLLAKSVQEEEATGTTSKYRKPVDAALAEVLPREKIQELTESQKQRLLYRLVHGGEKVAFDADGALRFVAEDAEADRLGESDQDSSEDETKDASFVRQPVRREKKKTQVDRNRHLRFLQQQRRRAAKLSSRERRAALARLDELVQECDEEENEREEAQKDKEQRLQAKIEAAKQGRVKLRIGRNRFVEPPPAVALTEDLSGGSLRAMKAVKGGGALSAHLTSLQRRGLVELPPTGGATASYLRRVQKDRARRLSSKKPIRRK